MSILLNHQHLHIELSSKCTLKCPRCPRTELHPDSLNKEISLDDFQRAFDLLLLKEIKTILFCGDIGDPIYNTDFLEIVQYIKQNSTARINIVTNASYKSAEWWTQLGSTLDSSDEVTFSVDGWDQLSNNLYRVNSNFESIVTGAKALRASSTCNMTWSTIYFRFNEDKIDTIRDLVKSLEFNTLRFVKSSKFDGRYNINDADLLKPVNPEYVAQTSQYEDFLYPLNGRHIPIKPLIHRTEAHTWAKCIRWEKDIFINVDGLVLPCPWFNNMYIQNNFVKTHRDKINIKTRTLMEILQDPLWNELYQSFDTQPFEICQYKCKDAR